MPVTNYQKKIYELLGESNDSLLSANQIAAKRAVMALTQLMTLLDTIKFGDKTLRDEMLRYSLEQILDDDYQWLRVEVDWKVVENEIGNTVANLFWVSQMRGWNLNKMAHERAAIEAERRTRDGA